MNRKIVKKIGYAYTLSTIKMYSLLSNLLLNFDINTSYSTV